MKHYLLPQNGNFYKANLHCHSCISDGNFTPEMIKEVYRDMGYSIVAYTDHDVFIPHNDLTDETFLALNGFEVEINATEREESGERKCCHICFIALDPDTRKQPCWHRSEYLFANAPKYRHLVEFDENEPDYERVFSGEGISDMMKRAADKGFFVTYNHPTWSCEDYRDYTEYHGMHAFEMFNGGCIATGYQDYNPRVYDDILKRGEKIYCIGADDNHNKCERGTRNFDSGYAFTVIKADSLDYTAVTRALLDGSFYASEGPEIYDLWYEDGRVHITTSPCDMITCNFNVRWARVAFDTTGNGLTEAELEVAKDCKYFRLTVTDKQGRKACTNAYFLSDLT